MDEFLTDFLALVPEACIESRLPAAGLFFVVIDGDTKVFQHLYHVHCSVRVNLVDETGNENVNDHQELPVYFFRMVLSPAPECGCRTCLREVTKRYRLRKSFQAQELNYACCLSFR